MLEDILQLTKHSLIISDAFTKADSVLNHMGYTNISCSISGGQTVISAWISVKR